MSSGKSIAAPGLLLALLAGCGHAPRKTAPPVTAQAPSLPPTQMAELISPVPPALPVVWQPPIKLDTTAPPEPRTEAVAPPPHKPAKHHSRSLTQETAQQETKAPPEPAPSDTPAPNTQVAAATAQPPENSPIGQLSTAPNDNASTAERDAIGKQIDETETALNAIKRPLSAEEQKTVAQIRTFITRAREALKNDDLDSARITWTKAHLLLQELTQQ